MVTLREKKKAHINHVEEGEYTEETYIFKDEGLSKDSNPKRN